MDEGNDTDKNLEDEAQEAISNLEDIEAGIIDNNDDFKNVAESGRLLAMQQGYYRPLSSVS